jgi:hypothetical protein
MPSNLPPVPYQFPLVNQGGFLNQAWSDWFQKIFVRVGENISYTNDELYPVTSDRIPANAVTFNKIQNINTDKILGRDTAGSGLVEEVSVSGGLEFSNTGAIQTSAFTGDVTKLAGSVSTTISNDAVSFIKLLSNDWSNVKNASGYQKLPSGVFIQWGVTSSLSSATANTITFPIAFPTACRQVIAGIQGNSASATTETGHYGTGAYTASNFALYNRTTSAYIFNYIAVGF